MRRLLLASFALLLTLLPFQAVGAPVPAKTCCPGCAGMPACPPKCPMPTSQPGPCFAGITPAIAPSEAAQAEAAQPAEPSPLPEAHRLWRDEPALARISATVPQATGPPDPGARQALLRIFRI